MSMTETKADYLARRDDARRRFFPCDVCYKQASAEANGSEEMGALIYDFIHFDMGCYSKGVVN